MKQNLPLIAYIGFVLVVLFVGVWIADRRATRREQLPEADALRRARNVTSPKER